MVAIVLPLVILARVQVTTGQKKDNRRESEKNWVKDWEWNIDEMAHACQCEGPLDWIPCAARPVLSFILISRLFRDYRSIELSVLAIVSIVAEVLLLSSKPFAI